MNRPELRTRLAIAIIIGLAGGLFAYHNITVRAPARAIAYDLTWAWRGGAAIRDGHSPYDVIRPTGVYPFDAGFKYPITLAVLSLPMAYVDAHTALALFGAIGLGLLAFGLTRDGYWRLTILGSAPVMATLILGQSSFFVTAAALVPAVSWLGFCMKPTAALAAFAYRPSWSAIVVSGIFCALCLFLVPTWPIDWLQALKVDPIIHYYVPALRVTGGPLLLLAALRWRRPEGRLLLTFAFMPQYHGFYSALLVYLVARTYREALALALMSWAGSLAWPWWDRLFPNAEVFEAGHQATIVMLFMYWPALAVVLRHPNEGPVPAWLDRLTVRWPLWLRGLPA